MTYWSQAVADIIYMRCSTRPQATRDSLRRQLDVCIKFAVDNGITVGWVFCDIASGDGPLPQREAAVEIAKSRRSRVLVESCDRWSRSECDESDASKLWIDGRVIECSETAREFNCRVREIIKNAIFGV